MSEKVILAGAGIGSKNNLTLAVDKALKEADVIIYDRLLNQDIVAPYLRSKEHYYVGKKASDHTLTQEQINDLIVKRAREGKKVVRLKGGDPYIFGRGSEEALYLKEHGLDFEVLPGVTSGVVCLNTAGIPATHRGLSASVSFITGYRSRDGEEGFSKYAGLDGTLVFYMGLDNIHPIVRDLLKGGMDPHKSAAVIMNGAGNAQKVLTSTLENIEKDLEGKGFGSPSLIVVGDTVRLREELNYFERRPLFGKTIAITRAPHQALALADLLEERGACVCQLPAIEIEQINSEALEEDIRHFNYSHLLFTSANAVSIFFDAFFKTHDIRDLAGVKIAVIGKKTRELVEACHLKADICPRTFVGEAFAEEVKRSITGPARMYFPHSSLSRQSILRELAALGDLVERSVYRTVMPKGIQSLPEQLDGILFTSSSAVSNFVTLYGTEIPKNCKIYSIGKITSAAVRDCGLQVYREAGEATVEALVDAIDQEEAL